MSSYVNANQTSSSSIDIKKEKSGTLRLINLLGRTASVEYQRYYNQGANTTDRNHTADYRINDWLLYLDNSGTNSQRQNYDFSDVASIKISITIKAIACGTSASDYSGGGLYNYTRYYVRGTGNQQLATDYVQGTFGQSSYTTKSNTLTVQNTNNNILNLYVEGTIQQRVSSAYGYRSGGAFSVTITEITMNDGRVFTA